MSEGASKPADERVRGLRAVARVLGCSVATVGRLLRRPRDPLRLLRAEYEREPWHLRSRLLAFRRRYRAKRDERGAPMDPELLATAVSGWIRIARIARVTVQQAQDLARREVDPLPVWYTRTGRVRALPCAVRDWYDAQPRQHVDLLAEGMRSEAEPEVATGDRARRTSEDSGSVKMENSCPPKKGLVAA